MQKPQCTQLAQDGLGLAALAACRWMKSARCGLHGLRDPAYRRPGLKMPRGIELAPSVAVDRARAPAAADGTRRASGRRRGTASRGRRRSRRASRMLLRVGVRPQPAQRAAPLDQLLARERRAAAAVDGTDSRHSGRGRREERVRSGRAGRPSSGVAASSAPPCSPPSCAARRVHARRAAPDSRTSSCAVEPGSSPRSAAAGRAQSLSMRERLVPRRPRSAASSRRPARGSTLSDTSTIRPSDAQRAARAARETS